MKLASVVRRIELEDMALYAGGDNLHGNAEAARAAGLSAPIVQGGQLGGYLHEMLVATFGMSFFSTGEVSLTFLKTVKPGDTLTSGGTLTKEVPTDDGAVVDLDIWLTNQNGEKVVVGRARAQRKGP